MRPTPRTTFSLDSTHRKLTTSQKAAVVELYRAWECAYEAQVNEWEFAEELSSMRTIGVCNSELRLLLHTGVVLRQVEVVGSSGNRTFRPLSGLSLPEDSCFVLSEIGRALARTFVHACGSIRGSDGQHGSPTKPSWDNVTRELLIKGNVVKRFRRPASNQERVLDAFQEDGWPPRIDDPLPQKQGRDVSLCLHDTVNHLNRNQLNRLIHFSRDGTGQGICWELVANDSAERF